MTPIRDFGAGLKEAFGSRNVQILLGMTFVLIALAAAVYRWAEGWTWLDAVYFSVITISTVGFGDFAPQTAAGKIFTIFYVLCGLGLFVATATAIADSIIMRIRQDRDDE